MDFILVTASAVTVKISLGDEDDNSTTGVEEERRRGGEEKRGVKRMREGPDFVMSLLANISNES